MGRVNRDPAATWDPDKEPMYLPLSAEEQKKYLEFDRQGYIHRRMQRWDDAVQIYLQSCAYLLNTQPPGHRYHKGGPLHFLGMCYFYRGRKADALKYFLLAYIEDLRKALGT